MFETHLRNFLLELPAVALFFAASAWALNRCSSRPRLTGFMLAAYLAFFVATVDYGRYFSVLFALAVLLGSCDDLQEPRRLILLSRVSDGLRGARAPRMATACAIGIALMPIGPWIGSGTQDPGLMRRIAAVHRAVTRAKPRQGEELEARAPRPSHAPAPAAIGTTADRSAPVDPCRSARTTRSPRSV